MDREGKGDSIYAEQKKRTEKEMEPKTIIKRYTKKAPVI